MPFGTTPGRPCRIDTIRDKRNIFEHDVVEEVEIHLFTYARNVACGATIYYRWTDLSTKKPYVRLMMVRTRIAQLKVLSATRPELQAAAVGARLARAVKKSSWKIVKSSTFWTDLIIVFSWMKAKDWRYEMFMSNRIAKVQDLTKSHD